MKGIAKTSRLTNLSSLNLPKPYQDAIEQVINQHKMLYETWIEPSSTYLELRNRLIKRGYRNVSPAEDPIISNMLENIEKLEINTKNLNKKPTMIQKPK